MKVKKDLPPHNKPRRLMGILWQRTEVQIGYQHVKLRVRTPGYS